MDGLNALSTYMAALSKQMQNLEHKTQANAQKAQALSCGFCGNNHSWEQCPLQAETTNFIGNFSKNHSNAYSNTYNPGWRNHPNFGWGGNQDGGQNFKCKPKYHLDSKPKHIIDCSHLSRRSYQWKKCSCKLSNNIFKHNRRPSETWRTNLDSWQAL